MRHDGLEDLDCFVGAKAVVEGERILGRRLEFSLGVSRLAARLERLLGEVIGAVVQTRMGRSGGPDQQATPTRRFLDDLQSPFAETHDLRMGLQVRRPIGGHEQPSDHDPPQRAAFGLGCHLECIQQVIRNDPAQLRIAEALEVLGHLQMTA